MYIADTWKLHTVLKVPLVEEKAKKGENDFVLSVAWSSSGKTLACGCVDGRVAVFDFQRGNFLHFLRHHVGPVRALKFSIMEERILFTVSDSKILSFFFKSSFKKGDLPMQSLFYPFLHFSFTISGQ